MSGGGGTRGYWQLRGTRSGGVGWGHLAVRCQAER